MTISDAFWILVGLWFAFRVVLPLAIAALTLAAALLFWVTGPIFDLLDWLLNVIPRPVKVTALWTAIAAPILYAFSLGWTS